MLGSIVSDSYSTNPSFYRIRNWNRDYEVSQSRHIEYLKWVPRPILINTTDYAEIMEHPDGMAIYGVWQAVIELGARCEPRGSLLKPGGTPLLQTSIAHTLRISIELLQKSISLFLYLGWLEELPFTKHTISEPVDNYTNGVGTVRNALEQKQMSVDSHARAERRGEENTTTPPPPPTGGAVRRLSKKELRTQAFVEEQKRRLAENA
jgi:hypothetical protein